MEKRFERLSQIMQDFLEIDCNPDARKLCPEMVKRSNYLLSRGSVVHPEIEDCHTIFVWDAPLSFMDYEGTEEEFTKDLKIYPFLLEDATLGPVAEYVVGRIRFAAYGASCHYIAININGEETDKFMAATLFHEIGHAMEAEKEGRAFHPSARTTFDERAPEELGMWLFDYRLTLALGGKKYAAATEFLAHTICDCWKKGEYIRFADDFGLLLNYCYGPALSKRACENRDNFYIVFCFLAAADLFFKNDKLRGDFHFRLMQDAHSKESSIVYAAQIPQWKEA